MHEKSVLPVANKSFRPMKDAEDHYSPACGGAELSNELRRPLLTQISKSYIFTHGANPRSMHLVAWAAVTASKLSEKHEESVCPHFTLQGSPMAAQLQTPNNNRTASTQCVCRGAATPGANPPTQ